jgi:hypothetical protein
LIRSLWCDLLLARRIKASLEKIVLQTVSPVLGDLLERVAEFLVGKRISLAEQIPEIPEDRFDRLDVARVAIDQQLIPTRTDAHVEERFKIFNVLILYAEQRVKTLRRQLEFAEIAQILSSI